MRKLLVATLLVGLGLTVGTHGGASAGGDGPGLSLGAYCEGDNGSLNINISGGTDGQLFDILVDGNPVAEDMGPNSSAPGVPVADGTHTVILQLIDGTLIDEQIVGSGCGEPVIAIEAACDDGFGALSVLTNENNSAFNYAIEVDGLLYRDGIGNSVFPEQYGPFPDGTYSITVNAYGPSETSVTEEIEIDCVDGDGGQPAVFEVDTYCDGTGYISVEIQSFTYGELFSITIDGTLYQDEMFSGEHEISGMSDGALHVVITSTTDGVVYDDVILVACIAPEAAAKATCEAGVGELWFKSLVNTNGYSFFVSVDGVDVGMWQDAPDTEGLWESLHEFPEGDHTVLIEWTHDEEDDGSDEFLVTVDCVDDTSGTPLPDSGSNTTPLLLAAGLLVVAGLGMLGLRRRTA